MDSEVGQYPFITLTCDAWSPEQTKCTPDTKKKIQSTLSSRLVFSKLPDAIRGALEEGNENVKMMSREVTVSGARQYIGYRTLTEYWSYIVGRVHSNKPLSERFQSVNDHEILCNELTQSIYCNVFFDVDCKYPIDEHSQEDILKYRNTLLERVHLLSETIGNVLKKIVKDSKAKSEISNPVIDEDPIVILIQESSQLSSGKISFHGLVKHRNLVFDEISAIKTIVLVALWACIVKYGVHFCFEVNLVNPMTKQCHNWLDLNVYATNRTFRCMYSTKKNSTDRPLLPIFYKGDGINVENDAPATWFNRDILFDALITMPNSWLFSFQGASQKIDTKYIVKVSSTQENADLFTQFQIELGRETSSVNMAFFVRDMEELITYYKPISMFRSASDQEQESLDSMISSSKNTIMGRHKKCHPTVILNNLSKKLKELHEATLSSPELKQILREYFNVHGDQVSIITREKCLLCIQALQTYLCEEAYKETTQNQTEIIRLLPPDWREREKLCSATVELKKNASKAKWQVSKAKLVPFWQGLWIKPREQYVHTFFDILANKSEKACFAQYKKTKKQILEFNRARIFESFLLVFHSESHYCYIKQGCHSGNTVYYMVDFITMQWWQGCYSSVCQQKYQAAKGEGVNSKDSARESYSHRARSAHFDLPREDEYLMKCIKEFKDSLFHGHLDALEPAVIKTEITEDEKTLFEQGSLLQEYDNMADDDF